MLASVLEDILAEDRISQSEKFELLKHTLSHELLDMTTEGTSIHEGAKNLKNTLDTEINTIEDIAIFCITVKYIVAPINQAIKAVPSNDTEYCHMLAKNILDKLGDTKAGLVISTWDQSGTKGCLNAERETIVSEFSKLLNNLNALTIQHTSLDDNLLLTAFVQEFERRLGQKRKSRGGTSLESVISFLFDYYHFPASPAPSHFDSDLEVDKWFLCKDGWSIGISCKRTLRERWKQLSQADRGTLSHYKIKELWHLITYDRDLSDEKIVRLGEQGQVFYLMDDSPIYQRCSVHVGMKNYVRPLSGLIADIRTNMK